MTQAKCMSDLMRNDIPQHLARYIFRQREFLRAWIEWTDLGEVPRLGQSQYVVPENRVRRDDLTTARIDNCRTHGVLPTAGRPTHDVIAHVFGVPAGIFHRTGGVTRDNGVAESRLLERLLPVFDSTLDVRTPLVRNLLAHVKDYWLYRFRNFRTGVAFFQPITLDERASYFPGLTSAVIIERNGKVTDSVIREASAHRFFW